MSVPRDLRTGRLLLRRWLSTDRMLFAALNADPRVMEHLPAPLSLEESDRLAAAIEAHFDKHGFGLWAVEIPGVVTFAGFVGLSVPRFTARFTPCVEIGWRRATFARAESWRASGWFTTQPKTSIIRRCRRDIGSGATSFTG